MLTLVERWRNRHVEVGSVYVEAEQKQCKKHKYLELIDGHNSEG